MTDWAAPASEARIQRAALSLRANNIEAVVVDTKDDAKREALARVPAGSEVYTGASLTLQVTGITAALESLPTITWLRKELLTMDRATQGRAMRKLIASPDVMLGSVHAVTEDGHLLIASATGSQLGSMVSGAGKVIWVIGAQKVVTDVAEGLRRIHEHSLKLESERLQKAIGRESHVNKVLITYREGAAGRSTAILVREAIGY